MTVHDDKKFVEIWLTRQESRDMALREKLTPIFRYYKRLKYFVAVYESGDGDLLQSMAALLKHNIELTAKAAETVH